MLNPVRRIAYVLIGVGVLAGVYASFRRFKVERSNRRVELAMEYGEIKNLAQLAGQPVEAVLGRFKSAGLTSVSLTEETLTTLEQSGAIRADQAIDPYSVSVASPEILDWIKQGLLSRGFKISDDAQSKNSTVFEAVTDESGEEASDTSRPGGFAVHADWPTLRPFGIGLDAASAAIIQKSGLNLVGRISNFSGASKLTMRQTLADLKLLGAHSVVFQGLEVFGYRGQTKEAAEVIRESGVLFGQVEFGKQKGDEHLGSDLNGDFIRVHSISDGEMALLDERDALDRFVRAARERNIRLCYIRMLTFVGEDPIKSNLDYLQAIRKGISRGGEMGFGAAKLFDETGVNQFEFGLIGLGVGAMAALLLGSVFALGSKSAPTLMFSAFVCFAVAYGGGEAGRRIVALLAALVYPTFACLRKDILGSGQASRAARLTVYQSIQKALKATVWTTAVTSVGILSVIGLLSSKLFIIKVHQFMGIKAAHALPLLFMGVVVIVGMPNVANVWAVERASIRERLRRFMNEPARVGALLVSMLALAALALIVMRTGNEPGVGVSGLELKFRSVLDRVLPVRPRTKEFLIGHPAFVLALALWYRGRRKFVMPLFLIGVIGQVSILNTFCHTHTPLWLSFVRDASGLLIGAAIGLSFFLLVEAANAKNEKRDAAYAPED